MRELWASPESLEISLSVAVVKPDNVTIVPMAPGTYEEEGKPSVKENFMKLVIIFGPHAVGKMTVGQELAEITDLKLFHNHMTIELVSNFFSYSNQEGKRLVALFRKEIFEAVARSDLDGLIFTFMWALDIQEDWDYIDMVTKIFAEKGADIYYVELEADFNIRIERNKTPNRLLHKPTKRDLEKSEDRFRGLEDKYRLNSYAGEIPFKNYIKINNTNITPEITAQMIKEHFIL